jgi:hypothetical protein
MTYVNYTEVNDMPRGDGTGPAGMGPMTGRGAGFCADFDAPGYANPVGYRCGFGQGRGFRRKFYATGLPRWARFGVQKTNEAYFASEADKKEFLKRRAKLLENQLDDVKKHLEEFED